MKCKHCGQLTMDGIELPDRCSFCNRILNYKSKRKYDTYILGTGLNAVAAYWYYSNQAPILVGPEPPTHRQIGPFFFHAREATSKFFDSLDAPRPQIRRASVGYYDGSQTKSHLTTAEREYYIKTTRFGLETPRTLNSSESNFDVYKIEPAKLIDCVQSRVGGEFASIRGHVVAIDIQRQTITVDVGLREETFEYERLVSTMPWQRFLTAMQLGTSTRFAVDEIAAALATPWCDISVATTFATTLQSSMHLDFKYDMIYNVGDSPKYGYDRWYRATPDPTNRRENCTLEKLYQTGDERRGWSVIVGGRPLYSAAEIPTSAHYRFNDRYSSPILFLGRNGANKQFLFDDVLKALQGTMYDAVGKMT